MTILRYHCPVYVVFDDDGVSRVVVGDDEITTHPDLALTDEGQVIPDADLEALHLEVEALDQFWPAWDFGF